MKLVLASLFLTLFTAFAHASAAEPVRVEQGLLSGVAGKNPDVRVYRGIPYATPPVGDLRWREPRPPAAWEGVKAATGYSYDCWQTPYPAGSVYQAQLRPLSEDCLYLNVWTPAKSPGERLPVMFWIHGGGLTRGSGGSTAYDGEILARQGVVLVTINYRLGVFGFFSHPGLTAESGRHASGNYGLLDQIAALQWVKKNIGAFGGDSSRVTIFGESAGSWSVNALMASPLAKGLFHRAIGESGGLFSPMASLAEAEESGAKLAAPILGAQSPDSPGDALKKLRAASAEELLKAQAAETVHPIVDGFVLPQSISEIFAQGRQNDVPLLLGNNADEGRTLAPQAAALKASLFVSGSHTRFGALADQFLKIYPAESDAQAVNSFYAAYRDQAFGWEMRTWARMQTKTGRQPAYLYYFTRVAPGPAQRLGAFHALELAYVFGNFPWPFPWEDADHKLSDAMVRYWVNFAATGNPNTFAGTGKADTIAGTGNANKSNLPKWPEYSLQPDTALELGDVITVRSETNKAGLDFFDGYFQSLRAKSGAGGASAQSGKAVK